MFQLTLVRLLAGAAPGDWPRFRGPNGAGIQETGRLPAELSATRNVAWKTVPIISMHKTDLPTKANEMEDDYDPLEAWHLYFIKCTSQIEGFRGEAFGVNVIIELAFSQALSAWRDRRAL